MHALCVRPEQRRRRGGAGVTMRPPPSLAARRRLSRKRLRGRALQGTWGSPSKMEVLGSGSGLGLDVLTWGSRDGLGVPWTGPEPAGGATPPGPRHVIAATAQHPWPDLNTFPPERGVISWAGLNRASRGRAEEPGDLTSGQQVLAGMCPSALAVWWVDGARDSAA